MTGDEHYREAERLLASAIDDADRSDDYRRHAAACAQVHAALALAAAVARPSLPIRSALPGVTP